MLLAPEAWGEVSQAQVPMGRPVTQHALLLQCMLVLWPAGVASRRGPVLLPESPCHKTDHPLIPHSGTHAHTPGWRHSYVNCMYSNCSHVFVKLSPYFHFYLPFLHCNLHHIVSSIEMLCLYLHMVWICRPYQEHFSSSEYVTVVKRQKQKRCKLIDNQIKKKWSNLTLLLGVYCSWHLAVWEFTSFLQWLLSRYNMYWNVGDACNWWLSAKCVSVNYSLTQSKSVFKIYRKQGHLYVLNHAHIQLTVTR